MSLLTAGYLPSTYVMENYIPDNYIPDYGTAVLSIWRELLSFDSYITTTLSFNSLLED